MIPSFALATMRGPDESLYQPDRCPAERDEDPPVDDEKHSQDDRQNEEVPGFGHGALGMQEAGRIAAG